MRAIVRRASSRECAVISTADSFLVPLDGPDSRAVGYSVLWCANKWVQNKGKYGILAPLVALRCSTCFVGWANQPANNKQKQPTRKKRARLFRALCVRVVEANEG